jgi:hypothetical protein
MSNSNTAQAHVQTPVTYPSYGNVSQMIYGVPTDFNGEASPGFDPTYAILSIQLERKSLIENSVKIRLNHVRTIQVWISSLAKQIKSINEGSKGNDEKSRLIQEVNTKIDKYSTQAQQESSYVTQWLNRVDEIISRVTAMLQAAHDSKRTIES